MTCSDHIYDYESTGLSHWDERVFYTSQWSSLPHEVYVLLRLSLALYSVYTLVVFVILYWEGGLVFRYLTVWTFALTAAYLSMTAVLGIVFFDRATRKTSTPNSTHNSTTTTTGPANLTASSTSERTLTSDGSSTWYFQLQWLLINMASPFAWVVTVVFFVFIYDGGACVPLEDVNIHILNLVWVLLDHVVRALPVRMSHVYQVYVYGVAYVAWSAVFWSFDRDNNIIYSVLDWNSPRIVGVVVAVVACVIIPGLHALYYGIYQLKNAISENCYE